MMLKEILLFGVLVAVVVFLSHFQLAACTHTATDLGRLSALIRAAQERGNIPGVALSIVNRSSVLVEVGYGVANVTSRRPMSADTLVPLGSTTKAFTSALLALLMDKRATLEVKLVQLIRILFILSDVEKALLSRLNSWNDIKKYRTRLSY